MKLKNNWLLALLTPILLWLSWPTMPFTPLVFVAFIPLLKLANDLSNHPTRHWLRFLFIYISFLFFNILTTWWVWNASAGGAVAAIILNALLMSAPVMLFYALEHKFNGWIKWAMLIVFWLTFEKIHLTWEFTWPWLTLGNVFSSQTSWVQWYEFTGHLGGSAWIWLCNISLYLAIYQNHQKPFFSKWIQPFTAVALPILFSFIIQFVYPLTSYAPRQQFILIQPNIDPYNEKFVDGEEENQLQKFISLSEKQITDSTSDYLVAWPETALPTAIWMKNFNADGQIQLIKKFLGQHKNVKLITGASVIEEYQQPKTATSNKLGNTGKYYDIYNAALYLNSDSLLHRYYKSKLVPGVERIPYPSFFKFLKPLLIDLGGAYDNIGTQSTRTVFTNHQGKIAPLICYESVFGSFTSGFVNQQANVLLIITNDGWWGNTPGYKQHFEYAKLRAIENRKFVLQCANNGTSGVIDDFGNAVIKTDYWKTDAIKYNTPLLNKLTIFSKYGNVMEWVIAFFSICFILIGISKRK